MKTTRISKSGGCGGGPGPDLDPKLAQDVALALEGALPEEALRALMKHPQARQSLSLHLRLDAALRVRLEDREATAALHEAVFATLEATPADSLQETIEAATIGHRAARRRLGRPAQGRWRVVRRWTAAAAAVFVGGLIGSLVWPELVLRFDLGPVIAAQTGQPFRIHGQLIADVPGAPAVAPASSPQPAPVEEKLVSPPETAVAAVSSSQPVPDHAKSTVAPITPAASATAGAALIPVPASPHAAVPAASALPYTAAPSVAAASDLKPPQPTPPSAPARVVAAMPAEGSLAAKPSPDVVFTMAVVPPQVDFEQHVLPLLERSCFECHSAKQKKPKGGIRLDDLEAIREKSRSDNLVFPHKPDKSTLVKSVSLPAGHDDLMPPKDKAPALSDVEIATIRRWVEQGADFGTWTSMRARHVQITTEHEAVDAAQVQATASRIDQLIRQDLAANGQEPRPPAAETTWLRRVYLDLVGRIPVASETAKYLKDTKPGKRQRLVDELLASNGHVSHMFNYWCDLLRARDELAEGVKGDFYLSWIKQSVRDNKPYDVWARELISPEGYGWRAPAAGYYLRDGENRAANIESTATLFLGTQISCAQCHDHPYDKWTRKDYHQFLAWTSGIQTATATDKLGQVAAKDVQEAAARYDRMAMNRLDPERRAKYERISEAIEALQRAAGGSGVVNGEGKPALLPEDYQYPDGTPGETLNPAVLYGSTPPGTTRPADTLAAWITAPENTRFSLTLANRLWAKLFGLPFAGPVDQVREVADCANPDLAQYLVNVVREAKYDTRQILRIFCLTEAYQQEAGAPPAEPGTPYRFPGPVVRRLTAEQVWDSMMALAVADLDLKLDFDPPGVAELESAVGAKKASEVTTVARKMAGAEERAMKEEDRRARLRKEMAQEFAGGGLERASELPQPTQPGHFLRMFGQGGRDFMSDAWSASTVPQALLMLNSEFFDHVARSGSPLATSLRGVSNARDVARSVFMTILTREPTPAELDACLETLGEARNPKLLARTLLSTAEFIFQK